MTPVPLVDQEPLSLKRLPLDQNKISNMNVISHQQVLINEINLVDKRDTLLNKHPRSAEQDERLSELTQGQF